MVLRPHIHQTEICYFMESNLTVQELFNILKGISNLHQTSCQLSEKFGITEAQTFVFNKLVSDILQIISVDVNRNSSTTTDKRMGVFIVTFKQAIILSYQPKEPTH